MQLDDDALVVLQIRDGPALDDRHAGCDRRIVAAEVRRAVQIVDLPLGGNTGATDVSDRNARDFELVLLLVLAVVKRPVTPAVADTDGDHAAAQPHVAGRYGSLRDRGPCRRGAFCCDRNGRRQDGSNEAQKYLTHVSSSPLVLAEQTASSC